MSRVRVTVLLSLALSACSSDRDRSELLSSDSNCSNWTIDTVVGGVVRKMTPIDIVMGGVVLKMSLWGRNLRNPSTYEFDRYDGPLTASVKPVDVTYCQYIGSGESNIRTSPDLVLTTESQISVALKAEDSVRWFSGGDHLLDMRAGNLKLTEAFFAQWIQELGYETFQAPHEGDNVNWYANSLITGPLYMPNYFTHERPDALGVGTIGTERYELRVYLSSVQGPQE